MGLRRHSLRMSRRAEGTDHHSAYSPKIKSLPTRAHWDWWLPLKHPMASLVLLPGMDGTGALFAPFIAALGSDTSGTVVDYPTDQALGYAALEALVRSQVHLFGRRRQPQAASPWQGRSTRSAILRLQVLSLPNQSPLPRFHHRDRLGLAELAPAG